MPPNHKRSPLSAKMTAVALVGLVSAVACLLLTLFPDIIALPDAARIGFIMLTILLTAGSLGYLVAGLRVKIK
ncbi:hypothetical protein EON76_04505 [bacterium]|nr:MAG: hypothetical protein EON76_04505 [bacterium]